MKNHPSKLLLLLLWAPAFWLIAGCSQKMAPTSASGSAIQGEGWESSGGSGVACFDTQANAEAAAIAMKTKGGLTKSLRKSIETLVTLEYWENSTKYHFEVMKAPSREKILNLIHERFRNTLRAFIRDCSSSNRKSRIKIGAAISS